MKGIIERLLQRRKTEGMDLEANVDEATKQIILQKNKTIKGMIEDLVYPIQGCRYAVQLSINLNKILMKLLNFLESNKSTQDLILQVRQSLKEIQKDMILVQGMNKEILKFLESKEFYCTDSYYWNLQKEKEKEKFEKLFKNFQSNKQYFSSIQSILTQGNLLFQPEQKLAEIEHKLETHSRIQDNQIKQLTNENKSLQE